MDLIEIIDDALQDRMVWRISVELLMDQTVQTSEGTGEVGSTSYTYLKDHYTGKAKVVLKDRRYKTIKTVIVDKDELLNKTGE